jgi:hypothetical protein
MTNAIVETQGKRYELVFEPVRSALSEGPAMLWGFQVFVRREGEEVGMKTCFVGRVSVQFRDKAALEGGMDVLNPVLYELATEKIAERLELGEEGDEILFA